MAHTYLEHCFVYFFPLFLIASVLKILVRLPSWQRNFFNSNTKWRDFWKSFFGINGRLIFNDLFCFSSTEFGSIIVSEHWKAKRSVFFFFSRCYDTIVYSTSDFAITFFPLKPDPLLIPRLQKASHKIVNRDSRIWNLFINIAPVHYFHPCTESIRVYLRKDAVTLKTLKTKKELSLHFWYVDIVDN